MSRMVKFEQKQQQSVVYLIQMAFSLEISLIFDTSNIKYLKREI